MRWNPVIPTGMLVLSLLLPSASIANTAQDDGIDPSMLGFDLDRIPQVIGKPRLVFNGFDDIRGVAFDNLGKLYYYIS